MIWKTNSAMHSFRSQVGKESSSQDLSGECLIIFHISASVAWDDLRMINNNRKQCADRRKKSV